MEFEIVKPLLWPEVEVGKVTHPDFVILFIHFRRWRRRDDYDDDVREEEELRVNCLTFLWTFVSSSSSHVIYVWPY